MSLYDIAYVTWPILLALLVAVPSVLLFANRRAWKNGYDEGYEDGCDNAVNEQPSITTARTLGVEASDWDSDEDAVYDKPVNITERLKQYLGRVDPPGSHY